MSIPDDIIATGFVADPPAHASAFPSAGENSSSGSFQAVYWRCIAVFFFTCRLNHPEKRLVLFTNIDPPQVDGVDLIALFEQLKVERVNLALTHRLPDNRANKWGNVFYVLDILSWLNNEPNNSRLCLMDSDIVVTGNVSSMFDELSDETIGFLPINYPADYVVNGVSRIELSKIFSPSASGEVIYLGGEIFLINSAFSREISRPIELLWQRVVNGEGGFGKISTEEHFWSSLVAANGIQTLDLSTWIKRMWTSLRHRNTVAGDELRPLWHLPAEKRHGFADLFRDLRRTGFSLDVDPASFRRKCEGRFGIPHASITKTVKDSIRRARLKIS